MDRIDEFELIVDSDKANANRILNTAREQYPTMYVPRADDLEAFRKEYFETYGEEL